MRIFIINFILAMLLVLNIFILHCPILGVVFGIGFIGLSSYLLGIVFFRWQGPKIQQDGSSQPTDSAGQETGANIANKGSQHSQHKRWLFGFLLFLCVVILPLTIIYYFYQLNDYIIAGFLILFSLIVILGRESKDPLNINNSNWQSFIRAQVVKPASNKKFWLVMIYLALLIVSYLILRNSQTLEAICSPWEVVSKWFFVVYFITTAWLIYLVTRLKTACSLILSSLHLFFTFSVANIIFPLGFGYDPFIHQATEKYILNHGFILPKPFYYLGQYSLVVFLSKIFQISHVIIDKNLVPLVSALLLPSTIYYSFKKITSNTFNTLLLLFLFLFIPFTIFTFTTPQNLADLLVIIFVFLSLGFIKDKKLPITYYLLPITILFIHPIAGMASIIFALVLWTKRCNVHKYLKRIFYVFLCFSLPLAFLIFSFVSRFKVDVVNNFNLVDFYHNLFRWSPDLFLNTNFVHLIKTVAYFIWQPLVLFLIIFILGIYGLYRNTRTQEYKNKNNYGLRVTGYGLLFVTFLILLINSLILFSFIDFPFLIDYERGDFSWRIFNLGVCFLIPLALVGAWQIFSVKSRSQSRKVAILILVFIISTGVTISLYFSYPRNDIYYYTRGFNTSVHDFNAIKYLDEITDQDYVVLANQQIGAAALTTFGFRYFQNKYFFYSIPTGGPLYRVFAKIAYDQQISYETIKPAMELTGANVVYFYLNDYWFNFSTIKPLLEKEADEVLELEDGKVWVFKFVKK